jgi:hypothetical protein
MHNNDGVAKTVIEHGGVTIDIDFSVIGPTIHPKRTIIEGLGTVAGSIDSGE